jgi:asparagine synthase (glutamine-hydrolysing)
MASGAIPGTVDPGSLRDYFATGSIADPAGLLSGVASVPAGHTLTWGQGKASLAPFWELGYPDVANYDSPQDAIARVRSSLVDSVRAHFVSDVPVGIFLSGGVDSAAILALAREVNSSGDLCTFSIAVDDERLNEAPLAERVAARFGSCHITERIDTAAAKSLFPVFLQSLDAPSIDGFNTWLVSSLARRQGMKVVLSGLGGDELFGGYPSFRRVPRLAGMGRMVAGAGPLRRGVARLLESAATSSRAHRLGQFIRGPACVSAAYDAYRGVFNTRDATELAAHFTGVAASAIAPAEELSGQPLPADPLDAVSVLELSRYMRSQLLRDSDVMSMAHGLELRVPFVDRCLFDTLRAIPSRDRLRPGKWLLKRAVPEIPLEVLQRPKRGFTLPYQQWLRGEYGDLVDRSSRGLPVPVREWYQRWCVFAYCQWFDNLRRITPK